jgi:hypothetical protein
MLQPGRTQADIGGLGGGGAAGEVVWNPGAAADPAYATTWAEVMDAFAESSGEFRVDLSASGGGTFDIPAGAYDLESRLQLSRPAPAEGQLVVELADGAVLQNLAGVYRNITLRLNPTAAPALILDNGRRIEFDLGVILENAGSYAGLEVGAGETVGMGFYRSSRALATSDVIVDLTAATARLNATFETDSQASTDWVSGIAGTTLDYRVDASYTPVTLSASPATVSTTRFDGVVGLAGRSALWWNPVDYFVASGGAPTLTGGDFTVGTGFQVNTSQIVTGIRFYWPGAPAVTIRCRLWDGAGAGLASVDVVTAGIGKYTGTFATPVTIPVIASLTLRYKVSIWETTGTNYARWSGGVSPAIYPVLPNFASQFSFWKTFAQWAAGNAHPGGDNTGVEWFPVEPVFSAA